MADVITLGGRDFRMLTNGPIKHDYWMMARVRAAGLDRLELAPGDVADAFVRKVLDSVIQSGEALVILGGMLIPSDLDVRQWTPDVAASITAFIETLLDPEDKEMVRGLIAQVIAVFFQSGIVSLQTSPTSSTMTTDDAADDPENDGDSISAPGISSSANSPDGM